MKFALGRVFLTPGAQRLFRADSPETSSAVVVALLRRHSSGDWGEMDGHDTAVNNRAVEEGGRLHSAYTLATGEKVWIITEADRSVTTILLPDEY
jgi:hypothetical protein